MSWRVFAAAVAGKSHADTGLPCQDAFAHRVLGDVLCAAVCDGASSAPAGHAGARFFAETVITGLHECLLTARCSPLMAPHEASALVARIVESARDELEALAAGSGTAASDYATTLVGVVAGIRNGWFFHVGDGVGVAQPTADGQPSVSHPENGEYANETFFVTGARWREHLRITPIETAPALVVLMSDGARPFVMNRACNALFSPFIGPVSRFLTSVSDAAGGEALAATLADPRTHAITEDDKTLLIARWDGRSAACAASDAGDEPR